MESKLEDAGIKGDQRTVVLQPDFDYQFLESLKAVFGSSLHVMHA